jgi:hypothetical protein
MTQYLYGAKVQGIQAYIFETNRLQDIAGASELIESLSGEGGLFEKLFKTVDVNYNQDQLLRNAAGEISYLFNSKDSCAAVVRVFEHHIATKMPGLTVSQAVVKIEGDEANLVEYSRKVQRKLQEQRNRLPPPAELGWMISERARRTGRPGVDFAEKDGLIDRRQQSKRKAAKGDRLYKKLIGEDQPYGERDFAYDLKDICGGEQKWLAVVHADGNNLGKLIQKLIPNLPKGKTKEGYRKFSETLESATVKAAQTAYREVLAPVVAKDLEKAKEDGKKAPRLPIRPVVIGGDDLTVILRAEHAVAFTQSYLAAFEFETQKQFGEYAEELKLIGEYAEELKPSEEIQAYFANGLTACAGIAIIKPKYPFHYAADLAEELCSWTKNIAKKIDEKHTPSSLHFHKVQASFVQDYQDVIEQELTTVDNKRLTAGPYFLKQPAVKGFHLVSDLLAFTTILKKKTTPAGPLRDYVGELRVDAEAAAQKLARIRGVNPELVTKELQLADTHIFRDRKEGKDQKTTTHLYDAIQLANL